MGQRRASPPSRASQHVAAVVGVEQQLPLADRARRGQVGRELHRRIEADVGRVRPFERLHVGEVDLADAVFAAPLAPAPGGGGRIGHQARAVHQQHWLAFHPQRVGRAQVVGNVGDEGQVVPVAVLLGDQHVLFAPVPAPRPAFVGPAQAEREVDLRVAEPLPQRRFEQGAAAEPVEVEAERADPVLARQPRLLAHHAHVAQVVEPEVGRQPRLVVAVELGQGAGDIAPFGEAAAPPGVVLRDPVELRQVERDQRRRERRAACRRAGNVPIAGWSARTGGPDDASSTRRPRRRYGTRAGKRATNHSRHRSRVASPSGSRRNAARSALNRAARRRSRERRLMRL